MDLDAKSSQYKEWKKDITSYSSWSLLLHAQGNIFIEKYISYSNFLINAWETF